MKLNSNPKITILGAGRWGSAMAIYLSNIGFEITLQCHSKSTFQHLKEHVSSPYLKDYPFTNTNISFENNLELACNDSDIIVISVPVAFLRTTLEQLNPTILKKHTIFVGINKGIERGSLLTVPEIVKQYFPEHMFAQLGGPCFPKGLISENHPVAETLACKDEETAKYLQTIFNSSWFRVYRSKDVKGVALLGAIKNVFAIAAGIIESLELSEESLSVLVTRGLSEMKRLCYFYKISEETLYGLSGLGDLILTCYSPSNSHNKNFGKEVGKNIKVSVVLENMNGAIAEGYYTCKALYQIAQKHQLDLPLIEIIYKILYEELPIKKAILSLMHRPLKAED